MAPHSRKPARWRMAILLASALGMAPCRMAAQAPSPVVFEARDAIMRGLAYFGSPDLALATDAALYHAYLKDRFGLPELCSTKSVLSQIRNDRANQPLYMFLRMAEPIPFEEDFVDPQGWINAVTASGMWYDKLPHKPILMDRIEALDLNDPYSVTHSLWAMAMAKHCFQAELDTAMEQRLARLNMDIATRNRPHWGDLEIEALAFAQYHDPSYIPPPEHIREIVAMQNPDGSWNVEAGDPNSYSQHTTILALWALLQYQPLAWPVRPRDMVVH
ncbi:MAG: hypothetical protein KF797_02125 [Flavobacteriales bacterium]|nr:hypothetical protein [Flavobacteriales bacterium]